MPAIVYLNQLHTVAHVSHLYVEIGSRMGTIGKGTYAFPLTIGLKQGWLLYL